MDGNAYISDISADLDFVNNPRISIVISILGKKDVSIDTSVSPETLKKLGDMYNAKRSVPLKDIIDLIFA